MAKELTVNRLYEMLKKEVEKGNGNKILLISKDDYDLDIKHDFTPRYLGITSLKAALKKNVNNESLNHYITQFGEDDLIILL